MIKKALITLSMITALAVFAACGKSDDNTSAGNGENTEAVSTEAADMGSEASDTDPIDASKIKTMKDVYEYDDGENHQESYSDTDYIYIINVDGIYYRAIASMPKDISDKIWGLDFDDDKREQKIKDLISPLEVTSFENLSKQIPGQEELDKLIGKTGQELFDEGWTYWYYNLENMEVGMNQGLYAYIVTFEYDGPEMENSDDFDFYEEFKDLKVKSVTFDRIGY